MIQFLTMLAWGVYVGGAVVLLWIYTKDVFRLKMRRPWQVAVDVIAIVAWPVMLLALWLNAEEWDNRW